MCIFNMNQITRIFYIPSSTSAALFMFVNFVAERFSVNIKMQLNVIIKQLKWVGKRIGKYVTHLVYAINFLSSMKW